MPAVFNWVHHDEDQFFEEFYCQLGVCCRSGNETARLGHWLSVRDRNGIEYEARTFTPYVEILHHQCGAETVRACEDCAEWIASVCGVRIS